MYTILITGINGFLGSHIAKRLSEKHHVIGLEYSIENLFRLEGFNFKVYTSDEQNIGMVFKENKIDILIHTATFYGRNKEDTKKIADTNLFFPFTLLDKCINNGAKYFINTDTVLDRFTNMYALSKRQFQEWLYFRSKEINAINIQLEHFYGPGCSNTNFITAMIEKLQRNENYIDLTKGEQLRNFIYYTDIIDAYELIINKLQEIEGRYNNFEASTDELITIKDIMHMLKLLTGSTTQLNFGVLPYRENELMRSEINNSKLCGLGWLPKISLLSGIKQTIK